MARLNPTLLDKLMAGAPPDEDASLSDAPIRHLRQDLANLDAFAEEALQSNVRRELGWLLNTTNLACVTDLERHPEVKTSVLNYGVADLAGKAQSEFAMEARRAHIREAVQTFEPRLNPARLSVDSGTRSGRENAVTFKITGDIVAAVQAIRVQYVTEVELDTGTVEVRE